MRRKASGATPFELADGASCSVRLCFPTAGAAGSGEHRCRAGAGKASPSPASTRKKAAPPQGRTGKVKPGSSAARDGRGVRPGVSDLSKERLEKEVLWKAGSRSGKVVNGGRTGSERGTDGGVPCWCRAVCPLWPENVAEREFLLGCGPFRRFFSEELLVFQAD